MSTAPSFFPAALLLACMSASPIGAAWATPCQQDRDCAPSSQDQVAWCHQNECVVSSRDRAQCRQGHPTPYCIVDANCDDADANTVSWCEDYRCHQAQRSGQGQCAPQPCTSDPQCNDFDFSTQDWCHQGSCIHARKDQLSCRRSAVSCNTRSDCLDGDRNTIDWCVAGTCAQAQRSGNGSCGASSCSPVTVVLQATRRGSVNNPVSGDRWKVVGDSYQIRYRRGKSSNVPYSLSYHCFELAGVQGQILSAELEMVHSDNTYDSDDPSETVIFRPMDRVPCNAALDVSNLSTPSNYQAIFDDLNDGAVVAQFTATLSDKDQTERFPVNATGLSQLRSLAGQSTPWGIGGGLSTADNPSIGAVERVFRGTDDTGGTTLPAAKLILQVRPSGCP